MGGPAQGEDSKYLQAIATIPLENVQGRIDHMSADLKGKRIFVSALGNHSVEIIDAKEGSRGKSLNGFAEPQGVIFVAEANKLLVASRADEEHFLAATLLHINF